MRSDMTRGGDMLKDEVVIDPDHIIHRGIGTSVEIPEAGYILDLAVFYDQKMVTHFGEETEAR